MSFVNATPHTIHIYSETAFYNLEKLNSTTWVAETVDKSQIIKEIQSTGNARISIETVQGDYIDNIQTVTTVYGELTGIPELQEDDFLIVSLPTQSMAKASNHPLASRMVTPFKVVRDKANTSNVLGSMGLSFQ